MPNLLAEKALLLDVANWLSRLERQRRLAGHWRRSLGGFYFPRHEEPGTEAAEFEERVIARGMRRLKAEGLIRPGDADLWFFWGSGSGAIELKREAQPDLLTPSYRRPAGRPSRQQLLLAEDCQRLNIRHAFCRSLGEVETALVAWGFVREAESDRPVYRQSVLRAPSEWPP